MESLGRLIVFILHISGTNSAPVGLGVLGLEPKTYALKVRCSTKLSYTPEIFRSLQTDSKRFGENVNSKLFLHRFKVVKQAVKLTKSQKSHRIASQSREVYLHNAAFARKISKKHRFGTKKIRRR